ncbi:MAG: hypothetical protein COA96_16160 [SAR86 cluster bacterium]|uniref:Uncharacterized protein n=1 Tax=SAR86 cluster bacterium TaxID=2030880 RepID=A0A2A5AKR1_9GAMM|nr:MAG: hypothetical protein COA96_16160 [SAR86 cluster bacterium]
MNLVQAKLLSLIILFFVAPVILAQDTSPPEASGQQGRLPYEVVVTPNVTISRLRKLLVQIEDDFFDKFNELNIDDDYDVRCYKFLPTGTHIKTRVCEPEFFMDARGNNASEFLFDLSGYTFFATTLLSRKDIRHDTMEDFEILQKKVEEFYRTDINLHSIGEAMAKVKLRLDNFSKDKD